VEIKVKIKSRLHAEEIVAMMALDGIRKLGSDIMGNLAGRPMRSNSVLD